MNVPPEQLTGVEAAAVATGLRHLLGEDVAIPDLREFNPRLRSALAKIESQPPAKRRCPNCRGGGYVRDWSGTYSCRRCDGRGEIPELMPAAGCPCVGTPDVPA